MTNWNVTYLTRKTFLTVANTSPCRPGRALAVPAAIFHTQSLLAGIPAEPGVAEAASIAPASATPGTILGAEHLSATDPAVSWVANAGAIQALAMLFAVLAAQLTLAKMPRVTVVAKASSS